MRTNTFFLFHLVPCLEISVEAFNGQIALAPSRRARELRAHLDGRDDDETFRLFSRRAVLSSGLSVLAITPWNNEGGRALAFPNKVSTKYDDVPKRRGPQVICLR